MQIREVCGKLAKETIENHKNDYIRWGIAADISFFNIYNLNLFIGIMKKVYIKQWIMNLNQMKLVYFLFLIQNYYIICILKVYYIGILLLFSGLKPVYYSPSSHTALAEYELEYKDLESPSIFVKFKLDNPQLSNINNNVSLVIWTTTPWTILANQAIGINKNEKYSIMENLDCKGEYIILHESDNIPNDILGQYKTVKVIKGEELLNSKAKHPIFNEYVPVIHGDYITSSSGTGLVHLAPGHGMDDYVVCRYN